MSEFLLDMRKSQPILENFISDFIKDIPKSNVLFYKYNNKELQVKLINVIEDAINTDMQIWYEDTIESDDLFGNYEWTITCEKMNRGVFRDRDEVNFMILLKSTLRSVDNMECYSHSDRTFIHCRYI